MFLRIVRESFARTPRRKVLTAAALALGMAVATGTLSVVLDVGDRLALEFRSLGANLRSEEHTSELQSRLHLVCRLLLEKKNILFGSLWSNSTSLLEIVKR